MKNIKTGKTGENIARRYLENRGYEILEMNFRKKCGEIDIISNKKISRWNSNGKFSFKLSLPNQFPDENILTFVEVKTLNCRDKKFLPEIIPEANVHPKKQSRFLKTVQLYLAEKNCPPETEWQMDVIAIILGPDDKILDLKHFINVL